MTTQDWINEQKIQAVQDRKDGKDYWRNDNLYAESDLIELLEAVVLYNVVGRSEQFTCFLEDAEEGERCESRCNDCKDYKGVSGMFSSDKLKQAYKDGVRDALAKGYGTFDEENYR